MNNIDILRNTAETYRYLYRKGVCSRDVAKLNIQPYLDIANERSKELAKKYNQKPQIIKFYGYVR